jgi:hypothetical protein
VTQPIDLSNINIPITVNLTPVSAGAVGFGKVLLAALAGVVPFPGGALTREYLGSTFSAALAADVTATYITQATADKITAAFSQTPKPAAIKVGTVAWATLAADLTAIRAVDDDWYGLVLDLEGQTIANQVTYITAAAAWAEPLMKIMIVDTEDPNLYAASSADIASILKTAARDHSAVLFSQLVVPSGGAYPGTVKQPVALCAAARWLAFDPDVKSVPFRAQVKGVAAAALTASGVPLGSADKTKIEGKNGNAVWLYGSAPAFIERGTTANGHPVEMILSAHWLEARVRARVATMAVAAANRGDYIGCDNTGASMIAAEINAVLQQGQNAGHWSSPNLGAPVINTTAKSITFPSATVAAATNAISFPLTVSFS